VELFEDWRGFAKGGVLVGMPVDDPRPHSERRWGISLAGDPKAVDEGVGSIGETAAVVVVVVIVVVVCSLAFAFAGVLSLVVAAAPKSFPALDEPVDDVVDDGGERLVALVVVVVVVVCRFWFVRGVLGVGIGIGVGFGLGLHVRLVTVSEQNLTRLERSHNHVPKFLRQVGIGRIPRCERGVFV
jgi:hypothetical protein